MSRLELTNSETRIVRHSTGADFLAACAGWLSQKEDVHNGLLSLAHALNAQKHIHNPPFIFAHVETENGIDGCAIFAEPDGLTLSEMTDAATDVLFAGLKTDIGKLTRVFGPLGPTVRIAHHFAKYLKLAPMLHSKWHVHRLDTLVRQAARASGTVRVGKPSDGDLVRKWGKLYDLEKPANVDIEKFLVRKLDDGLLHFWFDRQPTSVLTLSGTDCAGTRISSVYTPAEFRGKGYASALVHEMSDQLLASGKYFVTLNTEVDDPVERIYRNLGYYVVGQRVSFVFVEPEFHLDQSMIG